MRWAAGAPVVTLALLGAWGCARPAEPATMGQARELLREAKPRTQDLTLRCVPADAEVRVDGVPVGECGALGGGSGGISLGPGMHRVEVVKQGYLPYVTHYEPSGVRAKLTVRLRPEGSTEP